MEIHKWIQSEKARRDLGPDALMDWVEKYAAQFRKEWEAKHGKVVEDEDGVCSQSCSGICAGSS